MSIDGVLSYREQFFWQHSAKVEAGMVHVQVAPSVNEQKVIQQVIKNVVGNSYRMK